MQFIVKITTDNAAFVGDDTENPFGDDTGAEVARILYVLAERVDGGGINVTERTEQDPFVLFDGNGNNVGLAHFTEENA
jgi:hypothetical protein